MVNEKIGRFMDAHEVIKEVVKDRVFFDQSDGGVLLSVVASLWHKLIS